MLDLRRPFFLRRQHFSGTAEQPHLFQHRLYYDDIFQVARRAGRVQKINLDLELDQV